jgi:hypothetical protein
MADAEEADMKEIAADGDAENAENVESLLRAPRTEQLLVELFGQSSYFTILALAYKWRPHAHPCHYLHQGPHRLSDGPRTTS